MQEPTKIPDCSTAAPSRSADTLGRWNPGADVLYREFGLPRRHREAMPEFQAWCRANQNHPMRQKLVRAWSVVAAGCPVALVGKCGTGKTQLAAAIAYRWCTERMRAGRYRRFADLVGEFKGECYGGSTSEARWFQHWGRVGLLVVDELQESGDTQTEAVTLTRLFDHRYGAVVPTVLIANLGPREFAERVGPSIVDRIREGGVMIECNWESFRGATK